MKRFPEDTRDRIEQHFASVILKSFPYYGQFWSKFIGVRNEEVERLLPYKIQFPPSVSQHEKDQFKETHERICMAHYSQFCQLAGAHFQYDEALKALKKVNTNLGYFCFWEAFENFYMHIGNARNEVYHIYKCVGKIMPILPNRLKEYLQKSNEKDLGARIKNFEKEVTTIRNNIVHFARGANILWDEKFYLPLPIEKDLLWSNQLTTSSNEIQETTLKMKNDLATVESIINETQQLFGVELEKYIKNKKITFEYDD